MLNDNIKNLRKQKGYTQETLAQSLNIVRQTVSKWEKGYSVPDADMLEKLSDVLEVPVSDLLGKPPCNKGVRLHHTVKDREIFCLQRDHEIEVKRHFRETQREGQEDRKVQVVRRDQHRRDASNVRVLERQSSLYSQEEIESAIEVIKRDFENDWNGCTLNTIYYAGDEVCADETRDRGVKTIVLISDFTTGNYDFGCLNTNYTYTNWSWILIRDEDGGWKHIDHGYG